MFGGQVAGQALVAAGRTVDPVGRCTRCTRTSCAPAIPTVPIIYEVDRIRDGRSFTTRRVVGDPARPRDLQPRGVVPRRRAGSRPPVPDAGRARSRGAADVPGAAGAAPRPVPARDGRLARARAPDRPAPDRAAALAGSRRRASPSRTCGSGPTARCPTTRCCTSCIVVVRVRPHAPRHRGAAARQLVREDEFQIASLDHAMWFHRPFRADEWLLYHQRSPSASRRAGIAEGFIFTQRRHSSRSP